MSESFRPSMGAARVALGNAVDKITYRPHPAGAEGARVSLEEVARRIRDGKDDVRVRAWAGKKILKAGSPTSNFDRAQVLLDAVRSQTNYAPDPLGTELIVAGKNTLCLDEHGLCMPIGDCDDLCVALGSALIGIGIPTQIVGQSFKAGEGPSHVLLAVETPYGWKKVDPSSRKFRVGESYPATREWFIDPLKTGPISLSGGGNFIGIGATPADTSSVSEIVANQLKSAVDSLEQSVNRLGLSIASAQRVRAIVRPDSPLDPEPYSITSIADFPVNGIWTQAMENVSLAIWNVGKQLVQIGRDALSGKRKVAVDPNTNGIQIESLPSDPWRMQTIAQRAEDAVIGVFDSAGNIVSGFFLKSGKSIAPNDVAAQAQAASPGTLQGLGFALPVIVAADVALVAVVALAVIIVYRTYVDRATVAADQANDRLLTDAEVSGKLTHAQAMDIRNHTTELRKAQAAASSLLPSTDWVEQAKGVAKWVIGGGLVLSGLYIFSPQIKEGVDSLTSKLRTRRTV